MISTLITIIFVSIISSTISIFVANWMMNNPGKADKIMNGIMSKITIWRGKKKND